MSDSPPAPAESPVRVEKDGAVTTVILHRPEVRRQNPDYNSREPRSLSRHLRLIPSRRGLPKSSLPDLGRNQFKHGRRHRNKRLRKAVRFNPPQSNSNSVRQDRRCRQRPFVWP